MLRTGFITGGNPAQTGAFRCESVGTRAVCAANRRDRRRIGLGATAAGGRAADRRVMVNVFFPDPERMTERDLEGVAEVPALFDSNGRYLREFNRYMRERALLNWHPGGGGDVLRGRTSGNMAEKLSNFVQWCEARRKDWRTLQYKDVLRYQDEQLSGKWSLKGGKLEASTANDRADEATSFLRWAAHRKLRGPFEVKMFVRPGPQRLELEPRRVRTGRAKEDMTPPSKAGFVLPTPKEVRDWLNAVKKKRGYAKHLGCKFVMSTGARREEVELLEVDQWPTADEIAFRRGRRLESVPMRLFKTKGGRPRTIKVPLDFTEEVRAWIDGRRKNYALRHYEHFKERTSRLFLSDALTAYGRPISAQTLYRCFSEVKPRPRGWSPHKGRHTFACHWVLYALSLEAETRGGLVSQSPDWVVDRGAYWLKSLKRQFGHVSEETTEEYLRWLVDACALTALTVGYAKFLDGDPKTPDEGGADDD